MKSALMIVALALATSSHGTRDNQDVLPSSGVPCYLHPAADGCHYTLRPGSDSCTTAPEKRRLNAQILLVNRTLTSLEQQLIRLGVIPPDNTCSELPSVNNGGVLYSDLNLPPGTSGRYICDTGFNLQPLHERYEFTCTEDGIWDGNVTEVPVECLLSAERCDPPEDVLNGNISYTNGDSANILVGDVIGYSCKPGTELHGPGQRFCLRTGNWSGSQPECIDAEPGYNALTVNRLEEKIEATDINGDEPIPGNHKKDVIGAGVGSATALLLVALVVILVVVGYKCRSRFRRKLSGHEAISSLEVSDDSSGHSVHASVHTSSEASIKYKSPVVKKSSKRTYRSTQQSFGDIQL